MIPRECRRLAEVDFPIAEVSKHAAREKSIRHGHPATLHLWWARRPLASSRAVLLALLLPDPCDGRCPEAFKRQACDVLSEVRQPPASDAELRKALLWFVGAFANWDMAAHPTYLRVARSLVRAAHGDDAPLVVDPFAGGTVARARATCLCCGAVLPPERVRFQLAAQRGGADVVFDADGRRAGGARMTAVVTLRPGETGRHYRLPTDADYAAVRSAQDRVMGILDEWERGGSQRPCPVPDESTPVGGGSGAGRAFSVQRYGMLRWGDLFTARQKAALATVAHAIKHSSRETNYAVREVLSAVMSRVADKCAALVYWHDSREFVDHVFARQALAAQWNTAEAPVFSDVGFDGALEWVCKVVEADTSANTGQVQLADATDHPLPDQSASVWFTDPPYYDAVPYADLSDFFLVWLKRTLPGHPLLQDPFDPDNPLSPKTREAVQDETKRQDGRPKDRRWFEETMAKAFAEGRRVLADDGVGCVVFAHKTTEGWEALLSGMIRGDWTITGSWPIATEMATRLRARDSAALATSVHLICRPRPEDAPVGDWADVLQELPRRVADWMERLQGEGVRGADLVFACIGPALEIYSRFRAVETAEGRAVGLPEYLEKVWEVVGHAALATVLGTAEARARNGMAGALEEDARLTALFLWTMQTTEAAGENAKSTDDDEETIAAAAAKGLNLPYDVVRRFAQADGYRLGPLDRAHHRSGQGCRAPAAGGRARQGPVGRSRRCRCRRLDRGRSRVRAAAVAVPGVGRRAQAPGTPGWQEGHPGRRCRAPSGRRHHAGPRPRRHAVAGARPRQRAAGADQGRAGPRPGLPAPRQRALRALPAGQPGETPPRRDVAGRTEVAGKEDQSNRRHTCHHSQESRSTLPSWAARHAFGICELRSEPS